MSRYRVTLGTLKGSADRLSDAVKWLDRIGIQCNRTRYGQYMRLLSKYAAAASEERLPIFKANQRRLYAAMLEADEIVQIHSGIAGKFDDQLIEHLRTATSGPELSIDESVGTSSNRPRNIAFELAMIALLSKAELPLDFSTKADISFHGDGHHYLIECKRPQSMKSLEPNIREAQRQLSESYESIATTKLHGIVAIDATRIQDPNSVVLRVPNEAAIGSTLMPMVTGLASQSVTIASKVDDIRTQAVFVRIRKICIVDCGDRDHEVYCCQLAALAGMQHTTTARARRIELLSSRLQRAA